MGQKDADWMAARGQKRYAKELEIGEGGDRNGMPTWKIQGKT